jgi:spermidine/putrescine transport system substrate-binding protein
VDPVRDEVRDRAIRWPARLLVAVAGLAACVALAACGSDLGGGDTGSTDATVADTEPVEGEPLTIATAVLYIDKSQGAVDGPGSTLDNFTKETGIEVKYLEEINSNESEFAKLRPELENGSSGGRDLIVATDWMARKYYDLGYLQELDHSALPNVDENLIPALRDPAFDPGRKFSVPYQSGMTGLIVRTDLAPDITSINDLFDPKYKGKVAMLSELRDTVPLVMKADGIDPEDATKEDWLAAIDKIKAAVESGQIRDITGNDYVDDIPRGDLVAAIGWSGDAVQMQLDNPAIEFRVPDEGCIIWSDDMVIPVGAPNPGAAYEFLNFIYDPKNAAQISGYVNYTTPVAGVKDVFEKQGSDLADNELIFPDDKFTEGCSTQPVLEGDDATEIEEAWQQVTTG